MKFSRKNRSHATRFTNKKQVNPPDFFASAHLREKGPSGTTLRFLHYPSLQGLDISADDSIRAGAHSDYGSLTVRKKPIPHHHHHTTIPISKTNTA